MKNKTAVLSTAVLFFNIAKRFRVIPNLLVMAIHKDASKSPLKRQGWFIGQRKINVPTNYWFYGNHRQEINFLAHSSSPLKMTQEALESISMDFRY
jgi:hypothetical protein